MEEQKAVSVKVEVVDAVVVASARIDLIEVLKDQAAKSDNTIDDALVRMVEMARANLDWKGYAKEVL